VGVEVNKGHGIRDKGTSKLVDKETSECCRSKVAYLCPCLLSM
jgi:hypothetical protein